MRTAVMEGSLAEFDLPSVIQVVSLGRQYTGVELFDDHGGTVGTILLKSGKILAASSGNLSGLEAVFELLRGREHKRFSVFRTPPSNETSHAPVGGVNEVLLRLMTQDKDKPTRIKVMEGSLGEFDLVSVLQVIGLGRQFTAVEILDSKGKMVGTIEVKAGKVLSARSDHLRGVPSIRRLVKSPRESRFFVYRKSDEARGEPLGSIANILMSLDDDDPEVEWEEVEQKTLSIGRVVSDASMRRSDAPRAASPSAAAPPPVAPQPSKARGSNAEPAGNPFYGEAYTSTRGIASLASGEVPIVCVTSPKGGVGKTTVALNLAVALARRNKRVTLVDADHDGVLLALNAPVPTKGGAYDVAAGIGQFAEAVAPTRRPGLRLVPSGQPANASRTTIDGWASLFRAARGDCDLVLVDLGAGVSGTTEAAIAACTHALVVLSAEPASLRALPNHLRRMQALASGGPKLAGIVLNQLDYRAPASLEVLKALCSGPSARWTFDVPIARSPAFLEAVARGLPLSRTQSEDMPAPGWVFEMLASSLLERLGLATAAFEEAPLF